MRTTGKNNRLHVANCVSSFQAVKDVCGDRFPN